jgi:hypothetical protein
VPPHGRRCVLRNAWMLGSCGDAVP